MQSSSRGRERLTGLFEPRSIALVGVSDKNNMSLCVHQNLHRHGFRGKVFYVNPGRDTVHGQVTVKSLGTIQEPVDAVFALVSGDRLLHVVEEAAACGVRNIVSLAGGFSEVGLEGQSRQRELIDTLKRHDQLLLGPNTIGFINLPGNTVLYGSPLVPPNYPERPIRAGAIGAVVQSGIIAYTLLRGMLVRHVGPSLIAAVGNEVSVGVHDVINYLVDDESTRVIALFLETFRDHEQFRHACQRALKAGKPIVAMKAGRTALAARTALSHTGALIGDDRVNHAALAKLGVISVSSLEDLLTTATFISNYGTKPGRKLAFVSVSGGFCELFADRAVELGLSVPEFHPSTIARLKEILPPTATVMNPLDTTGIAQTDQSILPRVIGAVSQDPSIDKLLLGRPNARVRPENFEVLATRNISSWGDVIRSSPLPVMAVADIATDIIDYDQEFQQRTGAPPDIGGINHGLAALERCCWWAEFRSSRIANRPGLAPTVDWPPLKPKDCSGQWSEDRVLTLLANCGVPTVPRILAASEAAAVDAAQALGYPVVIKICSPDIPHKSAIGGVVLNVRDATHVREAFQTVVHNAKRFSAGAHVDGVLVMPMRSGGTELIVGIARDEVWGLVLAVGLGGVWTEVLNDSAVMPLPVTTDEVISLLRQLRAAPVLLGGHGRPTVDLDQLANMIVRVCSIAQYLGNALHSLEINPVRISDGAIEALDGLIVWRENTLN